MSNIVSLERPTSPLAIFLFVAAFFISSAVFSSDFFLPLLPLLTVAVVGGKGGVGSTLSFLAGDFFTGESGVLDCLLAASSSDSLSKSSSNTFLS